MCSEQFRIGRSGSDQSYKPHIFLLLDLISIDSRGVRRQESAGTMNDNEIAKTDRNRTVLELLHRVSTELTPPIRGYNNF